MTQTRLTAPALCFTLLIGLATAPALADDSQDAPMELGNGVETRLVMLGSLSEDCEAELSREFESEADRREVLAVCLPVAPGETAES